MEIIVIAFVMVLEVVLTAFIIALMAEKKNERPLVSQLKIKQRKADDLVAESAPYPPRFCLGLQIPALSREHLYFLHLALKHTACPEPSQDPGMTDFGSVYKGLSVASQLFKRHYVAV